MKKIIVILCMCIGMLWCSCVSADTIEYQDLIDEITNERTRKVYNIDLNAPFEKEKSGVREEIDIQTGSLSVSYDFFSLDLHGGQSLDFGMVYNPNYAKEFSESVTSLGDGNENIEKTVYESALCSFGTGWKIDIPVIEVQDDRNKSVIYVHLENGAVYVANNNSPSGLEGYKLEDLRFVRNSGTVAGNDYGYMLVYNDGTKYYFAHNGLCIAKTDRFENIITYSWDTYDTDKYRLSVIEDSCGRTVRIKYTDKVVTISLDSMIYTLYRTSMENGGYKIKFVTDPKGRKTEFLYHNVEISYNFCPEDFESKTNTVTALNRIVYPSGLVTCYEYTVAAKWLYEKWDGTIEYLKLKKRYDIEDGKHTNILTYNYEKDASGFPSYKELPDTFQYYVTETDSFKNSTLYTFDKNHNPIEKVRISGGTAIEESKSTFDPIYNLPCIKETKIYGENGSFRKNITERTYDTRGNLLSSDVYEDEKGANRVDYTYSSAYDICIGERYRQNDSVTVDIKREIDIRTGNVLKESILKNSVQVKCDKYTYNPCGDMLKSVVQTDVNTFLTTEYEYSGSMPYPKTVVQKNIADARGVCTDIVTSYQYDILGNPVSVTLPNGEVRSYEYDAIGRITMETLEDGNTRQTAYDDNANILTTTDARGTILVYDYDTAGSLVSVTDQTTGQIILQREYDAKKRLVKETDANGAEAISEYDSKDRLVSYRIKDADGKLHSHTILAYDDAKNTVTTIQSDGNTKIEAVYTYDMFQRLIQKSLVTESKEYTVFYGYDIAGNNISFTDESGNVTQSEYDIFGNPILTISPMGNTEEYTYDFLGNVTKHVNGEGDAEGYVYDALGRQIIARKYFDGTSTEYITYYDTIGNVVKTTDENGNETVYEYNNRSFLTSSTAYAGTQTGIKTEYEYDAEGLVTKSVYGSITDPKKRNVTQNFYDHLGNLSKRIDNSGKISYYKYDSLGQLVSATSPNGVTTRYEYDAMGRNTRISNGVNPDKIYSYNLLGHLESITEGDKYIIYTYDERGLVTKSDTGITQDIYIYDERGNVLEHTTNDKTAGEIKTSYTYDLDNRAVSVNTPLGVQTLTYDRAGRLTSSRNSRTGSIKEITYDGRGLPVSSVTRLNGNVLSYENNVYDPLGNKVRSDEDGLVRMYGYDGLGRLTTVSEDGRETLYEFDAFGNISKEHEINGASITTALYYYDADNRLILSEKGGNITSYDYDANGNLTREYSKYDDVHYEYDGYNRLTDVVTPNGVVRYEYNAEGLRNKKYTKDGVTRFVYDNANVSAEILPNGEVYCYYRADSIIGSIDYKGNTMYYSQNTHGDVKAIYDLMGTVLKDYRYNAYGKMQSIKYNGINQPHMIEWYAETTDVHNPFGYTGEYQDLCSGLIYLRNRYYDPSIGRFISEDPIRDGLNWYAYCGCNPVMFVDPWGTRHSGESITIGTGTYQDVWKIQNYLNKRGYVGADGKSLTTDGIFGVNTKYAVMNYQQDNGLAVDGIVGDSTWSSMGFENKLKDAPIIMPGSPYYDYTNDTVSDEGWIITATAVGLASAGLSLVKYGIPAIASVGSSVTIGSSTISQINPNSINHVFNKAQHNLQPLLESFGGNKESAYIAVQNAVQKIVNSQQLTGVFSSTKNPISVEVKGFIVQVGGRVIDGIFNIGTFYIK